ncbi:MAG: hypothetical protein AAGI07_03625 [Bacteroidota bacterium]
MLKIQLFFRLILFVSWLIASSSYAQNTTLESQDIFTIVGKFGNSHFPFVNNASHYITTRQSGGFQGKVYFRNYTGNDTDFLNPAFYSPAYLTIDGTTGQLVVGENSGLLTIPSEYKMAVEGKVLAEEVKVQISANWPDFVFADDYPLMKLDEVHDYIKQHGHLPGMPSAEKVAQDKGIELGEMNAKLLEKVEELTLYQIALLEEMKMLRKKIKKLEQQKN